MDDQKQAENAVVSSENEVESPTTEEEVAESPAGESSEQPKEQEVEPDKKPTRAERRIRDFSEKTKRLAEENDRLKSELLAGRVVEEDMPALFQPGETEIDPAELQARIDRLVDSKLETKLRQREAISQEIDNYRKVYEEHQKDLESVPSKYPELDVANGGDPELEKRFVELFDRLNSQTTRDGKKIYQPKVPATEVAEMILGIKKAVTRSEVAEFTGKTVKQEMDRAIAPTGEKSAGGNYELEELRNSARESGDERAWANYFKKAGIVKFSE